MKIIISGYGRMGREVEKVATSRGHSILATVDTPEDWTSIEKSSQKADTVIDFSLPVTAVDNMYRCFAIGVPVVVGTTGWHARLEEVSEQCKKSGGALFYAPNFSIGVNIFFKANKLLAKMVNTMEGYSISVHETHHIYKLDSPSGTAIKAAEDIINETEGITSWVNEEKAGEGQLPIVSERVGEVPGTHQVVYNSEVDRLILKHEAKSRTGFALGAVVAAEFLLGRKGVFTMDDLLQF